jgi:GrpB-like predicted nucleotidyltransferase (UPF0157 family)
MRCDEPLSRHRSLDERWDPALRIVPYDAAWPEKAAAELGAISDALGIVAARLEHVGSTSVPGLAAKPIIDLLLSVRAFSARSEYTDPLQRLGYLFAPDPESPERHFFAKPPQRPREYHLHVCQSAGGEEHRHIAVREFLRAHPGEAAAYADVKSEVAARHPGDRLAYISGKEQYIGALESRALAWAARRPA